MSKHPLARRARRLASRTRERGQAYADGAFFFTRPVGAPINYPEGRGENRNMSPRGEYAVTTGYTSGGEFLGDYYADGANTRSGGYGDGAFYFLQKFGQPVGGYGDVAMVQAPPTYGDVAMNIPADEPQVIRMGFAGAVGAQYGVATPGVTGVRSANPTLTGASSGRPGATGTGAGAGADAQTGARGGRSDQGTRADKAAYDIIPSALPELVASLVALGNAEYWKDFWSRARSVRRPPGYSDESEKQYEVANTTYRDALRAARDKETAYLKGLPKEGGFGRTFDAFRNTYIRKGWLDQAFRNVEESGRKASPSVVDAIKRDVFKPYAEEVLKYDDALLMAKRYIYASVESDWDKSKMESMLRSPGATKDPRYDSKYGVLKSGTTAYVSLKSYSDGPEWFYPINFSARGKAASMSRSEIIRESLDIRSHVIDDRWKMFFGRLFTKGLYDQITEKRAALDAERVAVEEKLENVKANLEQERVQAVNKATAAIAAERTVLDAKASAEASAQQARVAADAAKAKRTETETKALGLDVAGTEAAAAAATDAAKQADTYAKQAEATLAATASAFRTLGEAAKTNKSAIESAASGARAAAQNASIDAQSAVARIEATKAAKKAADDKAVAEAALRVVETAQQAVDAAQRNLDDVKARFAQKQATQADVDAAQRALDEANSRLALAKGEADRREQAAAESAKNAEDLSTRADTLGSKVPPGAVQPRGKGPTTVSTDKASQAGGEGFFSKYSTELLIGGAVLAIGGYFAWQKYGKKL
jgi:hypothetical protein